ncbi:MAG TPA: dolichyl-phosphate beta-glucosyltransferase [Candidatus Dormibacteraeota bacterium]|nr:dolichyl-phosphate beta-glucosyltransferase [Candidatus Dormibacteraeota bacterium]
MLSVVVPAFNEAARLPPTLARLREWLDAGGEAYEVIVVDDGSRDETADATDAVRAGWPELELLRLPVNTGKGAAVRAGMLRARGDLRLFSDADLSAPIEDLPRLRERIGGRCHVAIGSRAVDRSLVEVHQPFHRELMGRANNLLIRALVLPGIRDTQCGFKLFTADAAIACFAPLRTLRFGFDVEVLVRARRCGWTVAEVPVRWRHVEASRVHPLRDSTRMIWDLARIRLRRER